MSFLFRSALSSHKLVRARCFSHIHSPINNNSKVFDDKSELAITSLIKKNNIKLVIFDKDGTLIEFRNYWSHWTKLISASLCMAVDARDLKPSAPKDPVDLFVFKELGCDPDTGLALGKDSLILSADGKLIKDKLSDVLSLYIYDDSISYDELVDVYFKSVFMQMEHWINPIGDIGSLFDNIKNLDCKIGVYTADFNCPTKLALDRVGVLDDADYILASDSKPSFVKPSSDAIEYLAQQAEVNIDEVLMIGDSTSDIISAKQAGAYACGVLSGVASFGELNSYNADLIFKDIMAKSPVREHDLIYSSNSI